MSDHDFEKRVKQKMDELRFKPSEAVWQNLERELRKDKPSRRGWLWIPAALLLLGTGGYFAVQQFGSGSNDAVQTVSSNEPQPNNSKNAVSDASDPSAKTSPSNDIKTGDNSGSPINANELSSANEKNSTLDKGAVTNKTGSTNSDEQPKTGVSKTKQSATGVAVKEGVENKINVKKSSTRDHNESLVVKGRRSKKVSGLKPASKSYLVSAGKSKTSKAENSNEEQSSIDESGAVSVKKSSSDKDKLAESDVAADKNDALASNDPVQQQTDTTAVIKTDSTALAKAAPQKAAKKKTKYKWEWGVNGGAGISNLGDGNFDKALRSTNSADIAMSAPTNNFMFAPQSPGIPRPQASEVKPGFHFSIGGYVRKQFTKRLSVSTGLQYARYNNTIDVGNRVDAARLVNNGAQVLNVARYYRADNSSKFSNKYHFVEVPVYLHTQLNNSKTIPLFWNLGVTVSQMFASDALIFDSGTGVYYKDKKFYRNTQVAAGTGFSVGLFSNSRFPVWIGPSGRYQATQLFNNQISGKKHLMSASMDIRVRLNHK